MCFKISEIPAEGLKLNGIVNLMCQRYFIYFTKINLFSKLSLVCSLALLPGLRPAPHEVVITLETSPGLDFTSSIAKKSKQEKRSSKICRKLMDITNDGGELHGT
jgi:hypothetical protein